MNKLDKQYQDLLQDILDNGVIKGDRTGTGTISVFGRQIRHNMKDGFPLLTTKKMPFKTIVTELIWFLKGDTNIKFLVDNGCNIWNGDAYKNYIFNSEWTPISTSNGEIIGFKSDSDKIMTQEIFIDKIKTDGEFAKKWGELGPIYGKQWRQWNVPRMEPNGFDFNIAWEKNQKIWEPTRGEECGPSFETFCMSLLRDKKMGIAYGYHTQIDQIQNSINLLKTDPDSRRNIVSAWNVGEIENMVLPPCHNFFQFYTRELSQNERWLLYCKTLNELGTPSIIGSTDKEIMDGYYSEYNIPKRAISLMWNQRSVDTFLGLPFNIASYGLLLEIIAKEVNMVPEELIGNLGDTHLYSNHIEQAKEVIGRELNLDERLELADKINPLIREDCLSKSHHPDEPDELKLIYRQNWLDGLGVIPRRTREPLELPRIKINDSWKYVSSSPIFADKLRLDMFELVGYESHGVVKAPLSN